MSPIGSPDFGANPSTNPTSPSYDTGEDTTRVLMGGGSQARSGRWIFATGFEESSIPFMVLYATGAGFAGLYKTETYQGVGALQLRPDATAGNYALAQKIFQFSPSVFGFEFMLLMVGDAEISIEIDAYGLAPNDTGYGIAKIVIVKVSGTWGMYIDRNGTRELISNIYSVPGNNFRYFKIVYDPANHNIKRVSYANKIYEINAPDYPGTVTPFFSSFYFKIQVNNTSTGVNQYALIDNLIVTADEP